jgi:hypothetical protein
MYNVFSTAVDPAGHTVGPLSPLPCQDWHGYGVSSAHHGEVRECRRACERTPLRGLSRCAAGGRQISPNYSWVIVGTYYVLNGPRFTERQI